MEKDILYKYFEGIATPEEEAAIYHWLDASPENEKEFFREREFFDTIILSGKLEELRTKKKSLSVRIVLREVLKIAAIIILTITCGFYFQRKEKTELLSRMNTITVPVGQRVSVELSDGTVVWLNSSSKMEYPSVFSNSKREVKLDGEAYFEVAHNAKNPFIVNTQKCNIEVLGTKFNVNAYSDSDDFSTSLLEGSVKVDDKCGMELVTLKPGEELCMHKNALRVIAISDYNQFRWKEGLICFKDMSFVDLMKLFEKCYGVTFVINNSSLENYFCTGKLRIADGLEKALRVLQEDAHFVFNKDEGESVIYIN